MLLKNETNPIHAEGKWLLRATAWHQSAAFILVEFCRLICRDAEAESVAVTDWRQIVALYDQLVRIQPSPVVQLNRAVVIAMRDGPEAGLTHIDPVLEHGELANYYLAHSARADMYRRLGRTDEARASYEKALARQEPECRFLARRLDELK